MKMRLATAVLSLVLAVPAYAATPIEIVQYFYDNPAEELNLANIERFTGGAKAVLEASGKAADSGEASCIGFVPSVDGQDFDERELKQTLTLSEAKAADQATVVAKFESFEAPMEVIWTLSMVDGEWKVSDIGSKTNNWTLSKMDCGQAAQ